MTHHHTTDTQRDAEHGPGCAICDGFGGMPVVGTWTICPNCSTLAMGAQHYRNSNNRSVLMVEPERFVRGIRRMAALERLAAAAYRRRDALAAWEADWGNPVLGEAYETAVRNEDAVLVQLAATRIEEAT